MQCFNTEYAWFVSRDEARLMDSLRTTLKTVLRQPVKDPLVLERSLVLVALYDSLHNLAGWERLLKPELSQWSEPFRLIAREQLHNHKREQEISLRLTALTEIKDKVSCKVRRMYEENPYPRWIVTQRPHIMTVESLARSLRPGKKWREIPRPASILVAGCGTGQHPIQVAMTFKDSEVLAVDLSRASLAYAARMAERFDVTNVTFQQADILELGKMDRRFYIIECGGVLHHLKDPLKGWQVLVDLLEPDGMMKIALYSSRARCNVQAARNLVRTRKFPPTPDGVRECRRAILELPEAHPARSVLTFRDFFSHSECRDLIMHVQERYFTLREIADCLDQLNLRFIGFLCDVQLLSHFRSMFPGDDALTDLALWDRFEEATPDTFRSMYQFWCCRK
jgi:SAM-dependent methyltransferase